MKHLQRKYKELIEILREVYFEKEHVEVGEQWQVSAMRRIRDLEPILSRPNFMVYFERFIWRLTPATCALIFIFAALLCKFDVTLEYEVLASFIYDTEELTLTQLFKF